MLDVLHIINMIGFLLAAPPPSISSYLLSPYAIWFPIASLAAITVILILGLIYMITRALGRTDFGTWVRVKIYDVLASMLLFVIFFIILSAYFDINPVPYYAALGIVPQHCLAGDAAWLPKPTDFYSLAACDMSQFINYSLNLNSFIYGAMLIASITPVINVDTNPLTEEAGIADWGLGFTATISVFPIPPIFFAGDLLGALYPLLVINRMQLLLLSSSLLLFSLFMAIGLTARIFGITRTFGGSMIALGVGVGVLYPLLVSFTYGFLNAGIVVASGCSTVNLGGNPPICLLQVEEGAALVTVILQIVVVATLGIAIPNLIPVGSTAINSLALIGNLVSYAGIVVLGISLIPFINFLVLDTFVIDFSRAIGEKIDFLALLTGVV